MTSPVKDCTWLSYPLGDVTQWFGENPALYDKEFGLRGHNGIDIVRPWGDHLFAVENGVICDLKDDPGGYGMHIRILAEHKKGQYREWTYGHMSRINVAIGQHVTEGQYLGNIGNTGFVVSNATANGFWDKNPYAGTHVHFGLRECIKDPNGWKYPYAASPRITVLNYSNGNKGSINPLPFFFPSPKAAMFQASAERRQSKLIYTLAEKLQKLNM